MTDHPVSASVNGTEVRVFPALRIMERNTPPTKFGRRPYWRPEILPVSEHVYTPTWNWQSPHDFEEGSEVTVLDVAAAYLAAIGSVKVAHSHLIQRGPLAHLPAARDVVPGYYKISVPYWAFDGTIVHPLGNSSRVQTESALWIAAPTLQLLCELEEAGHIGGFAVLDSYTSDVVTDFRAWAERLRSLRTEYLERIENAQLEDTRAEYKARYDALKQGYSVAVSMMLKGEHCLTRRPDWAHHIYAQHAASTWRKAWRYSFMHSLVSMGAVDEISVLSEDLPDVLHAAKPPFRLDPLGRMVGAFRAKSRTVIGMQPARVPADVLFLAPTYDGDIL